MAFNSLFGSKPAGQTGGSLFGQSTTQPQGSLFGSTQQQPQQQPQAGTSTFGGFGQTQNTTQGSSLFGSTLGQNNQQQQPQQGSSLFGSTLGQNTQQPQQPQQGSSLFGNTFGQPQQQPQQNQQTGTSLFGQPAGQQQQQKPLFGAGSGSLFGNTTQNQPGQPQQGGFGTFGSSSNTLQSQPTQSSLFGNTTTGTQAGSSLWGRPPTQQQQVQQPQGAPLFTKSTKFNDLSDEAKKVFENIDSAIQGKVQICNDLKQRKLGEEPLKGQEEIRNVHKASAISVLTTDVQHTKDLKHKVEQTVQDTIVATRIVEGFRNPQQHGQYLKTYANFPLEFFNRVTEEMKERLRWYKTTIEHIERKLSSAASQPQHTPQAIVSTLEAQHATFMALAAKAAALDAELQKLRTLYTQLWRAKTGSMRDPFNELDRGSDVGELGLESLSAK
ncbi:hypothetical protein PYCCODRAFT_1472268 [Trametes coccinea BRFM310]|uniref:Nucleoporin Nup54 alpha-helical domain-containing protein n=1 Tax=Trametes coccinea (strain BRFM310) TaxID=1353009 RepID=A0A1Y2I6V2_TRAC3|nr:hypothetical protein PYCCODRAFT_1472268 [Trametes coccinea BRFM310]